MGNIEKLQQVFIDVLNSSIEQIPSLRLKESENWDSVGHIALIAEIEETFDINLDTDDMFNITSFDSAIKILGTNYNIKF